MLSSSWLVVLSAMWRRLKTCFQSVDASLLNSLSRMSFPWLQYRNCVWQWCFQRNDCARSLNLREMRCKAGVEEGGTWRRIWKITSFGRSVRDAGMMGCLCKNYRGENGESLSGKSMYSRNDRHRMKTTMGVIVWFFPATHPNRVQSTKAAMICIYHTKFQMSSCFWNLAGFY